MIQFALSRYSLNELAGFGDMAVQKQKMLISVLLPSLEGGLIALQSSSEGHHVKGAK